MSKTLVAYFSASGVTARVAAKLAKAAADLDHPAATCRRSHRDRKWSPERDFLQEYPKQS